MVVRVGFIWLPLLQSDYEFCLSQLGKSLVVQDINRPLIASEWMLFCVFCSPKSSTVVLATFCRASSDFPHSHLGHPPNMVTCVCPGPKLKAVAVCHIRDCAPSGRVSWGEGESWVDIDKLLKRSWLDIHNLCDIITSWIILMFWGKTLEKARQSVAKRRAK